MNRQPPPPPTPEQQEGINKIANLFKPKKEPYVSITKSIKDASIDAKIMDVNIDDNIVECLVIPVQEMVYKEWRIMSGSELVNKPQIEENNEQPGPAINNSTFYSGPEVGGPSDVQSGPDQPGNGSNGSASELQ